MKIVSAQTGKLQPIPFSLGESGRGRWREEVKTSNRPGQEPTSPEDVGYFVFGQERKHAILTKSDPSQRGILLRVDTQGTYTRAANTGSVALKGGKATMLVRGYYADGDAGNLGSQADELWHVESPSIFVVTLSGGSYKGYGHRYLIVTSKFEVVMIKRDDLCQMIATDERPDLTETVRMFADKLHEDVRAALKLADELEESEIPAVQAQHFASEWRSIEQVVADFGIAVPAVMGNQISGVSGLQSGTLIPGEKALAAIVIGPGGGKRYRVLEHSESGLTRLKASEEGSRYTVLAIVEAPDWHSAWVNSKDGKVTDYVLANAGGVHTYYPDARWGIQTQPWSGIPAHTPTEAELRKFFDLDTTSNGGNDEPGNTAMGEALRGAGF